jgi:hypothetical protein
MGVIVVREIISPPFISKESVKPGFDVVLIFLPIVPGINLPIVAQVLKITGANSVSEKRNQLLVHRLTPKFFIIVKGDVEIPKDDPVGDLTGPN